MNPTIRTTPRTRRTSTPDPDTAPDRAAPKNTTEHRNRQHTKTSRIDSLLTRPLIDFQIVVGITTILTVLGLMMVLSSSSIESLLNTGSPYARFLPQAVYAAGGALLFVMTVRLPTTVLRRAAPWLLIASFVALILVLIPGIGSEQYGAQSWIPIGSVSFQPSEFAKVALVIWCAHIIASTHESRTDVDTVLRAVLVANAAVLVLVVLQRDLGTAVTLGIILMSVLWYGGFRTRTISSIAAGCVLGFVVFTVTVGYRSDRIRAYLNPTLDPQGLNYQGTQATYALANGGVLGKGLGQSDAKWSYLPQAYNDFIFAVIGEELGLIGALAVTGLFATLGWVGLRIALLSTDPFHRMISAVATTWIVVQATVNIGYVIGLLPITGLQLPLISAGGTSMLTTLLMFGLIAHAAYREPDALISLHTSPRPHLATTLFGRPTPPAAPVPTRRSRTPKTPQTPRTPSRRAAGNPQRAATDRTRTARRPHHK
ncbi:MAG: putative lipid II flippase FtsW [Rhodococcus sp. (in: high G+C Gram-positive bacteria)]|uniref:putative lipid II flippase FtsW n=1 Tax=Rhodococcus sp. TaxID=1831 RepID=UPI003BB69949